MHGTVVYRREALAAAGGFDETLRRCEDYDAYLRLAREHLLVSHPVETALYRQHGQNMSAHPRSMLSSVLAVHARHRPSASEDLLLHRAWQEGRAAWRAYYVDQALRAPGRSRLRRLVAAARLSPGTMTRRCGAMLIGRSVQRLPPQVGDPLARLFPVLELRPRRHVRLGDLGRTQPVSPDFGWDRGTPVDRHYIERFLERMSPDIGGRVLEVGDDAYSRRFGADQIRKQDVLHVHFGNPRATIVGDLAEAGTLPESAFDCIVLTQTLHLVYDLRSAVRHLHGALRPRGALLLTVPGISQLDRGEWGEQWFWSLTTTAVQRLLADVFQQEWVHVESHGNVFAAIAFLEGLAWEEIDGSLLDVVDPAYPVIVTARAQRAPSDD